MVLRWGDYSGLFEQGQYNHKDLCKWKKGARESEKGRGPEKQRPRWRDCWPLRWRGHKHASKGSEMDSTPQHWVGHSLTCSNLFWACAHAMGYMWKAEDTFWASALCSHHVGFGDWIQVFQLGVAAYIFTHGNNSLASFWFYCSILL